MLVVNRIKKLVAKATKFLAPLLNRFIDFAITPEGQKIISPFLTLLGVVVAVKLGSISIWFPVLIVIGLICLSLWVICLE
jgi:hypothetical protein